MAKIGILLPDLRGGGVERIRLVLAHQFTRAGHEVQFIVMQAQGQLLEEARSSFSVINLATTRVRNVPVALSRYLRYSRPDALMCAMWPLTVVAPFAARLSGHRCKVLVSEHNRISLQYCYWGWGHRAVLRSSMAVGYRLADRRVAVSAGVADDIATLSGLGLNAFDVIHNPAAPRAVPSADAIHKVDALWSCPKGARLVTVGSMKAQKNHSLLLRAFAKLDNPHSRLMFVGDGPGRDAILELAKELGVTDRVVIAGFHSNPTAFYRTADLFVLSSDYEGFGNVIVEALACGTPVISTDCPSGPAEILENGKWGRLTPVGNADALAAAMLASLEEKHDVDALKRRASDFSPEMAARKYLDLLDL